MIPILHIKKLNHDTEIVARDSLTLRLGAGEAGKGGGRPQAGSGAADRQAGDKQTRT
jgi:hypothetical protein